MITGDMFVFSIRAAWGNRGRTALMLLAVAIGVASVVLLISLGESARKYVSDQFSSMGSNLLIVLPGRSETVGGPPPLLGVTPRDLTLDDAAALTRISVIRRISPIVVGAAPVSRKPREREVMVLGAGREIFAMRRLEIGQGVILPESGDRSQAVCVLGAKLKQELFGNDNALGQKIRIGDYRFQVVGVLREKGNSLGDDLSDMVIVPIASAQALFDTSSLFRIVVEADSEGEIKKAKEAIIGTIRARHDGEDDVTVITQDAILATFAAAAAKMLKERHRAEDFTITTQEQMLTTLGSVLDILTIAVSALGGISLLVGGVGIFTIMTIAVNERRAEIGLLSALGATRRQVLGLFLGEAVVLSLIGGLAGLVLGVGGAKLLGLLVPALPTHTSWTYVMAAELIAVLVGLGAGVLPARHAAAMPPVEALRAE